LGQIRAILHDKDKQLLLKIEKYSNFDVLPKNIQQKCLRRQKRGFFVNRLWLLENDFDFISETKIRFKIDVFFENEEVTSEIIEDDEQRSFNFVTNSERYFVQEILYEKPGHSSTLITRHISQRHKLPIEYIKPPHNPRDLPEKKFFLDLYYDDFGTYRTVYHSLGGVYVQFGNMPFSLRKQLKNHFIIGFVPFGASFTEFIKPFLQDIHKLEEGIPMYVHGQEYLITGGLGIVTADLPQGNDLSGTKRHGANFGCRNCFANKENFTDNNFDIIAKARYLHEIIELINKRNLIESLSRKLEFNTKYGLSKKPSPFSVLQFDPFTQIPQDAYHAISGKIARLMESTIEILSKRGENDFIKYWKNFEMPSSWSKMQNPISHYKSLFMSDQQRLTMIMPFILKRFLSPGHLKKEYFEKIKVTTCANSQQVIKKIIECWVKMAMCAKQVFFPYFRPDDYKKLNNMLCDERESITKV
jgi:hypothetical protein